MDAETKRLIQVEIQNTITDSQNTMMTEIKNLITSEMSSMQRQNQAIADKQLSKIEESLTDTYKFKKRGNEEQSKHNTKVLSKLKEADDHLAVETDRLSEHNVLDCREALSQGMTLIQQRQKMIKLADSSEAGWLVVHEYESNPLADNSDDEKRIFKAQTRAERKLKEDKKKRRDFRRYTPYSQQKPGSAPDKQTGTTKPGRCFGCGDKGHWKKECPKEQKDKISDDFNILHLQYLESRNSLKYTSVLSRDQSSMGIVGKQESVAFHARQGVLQVSEPFKSPVGYLRESIDQWQAIGTSEFVIKVIKEGYALPFKTEPIKVVLKNNKSAEQNPDFVTDEIAKLVSKGCVIECSDIPQVVNPLTVAKNKAGKLRLVLDCRHINASLFQFKFKYENADVARVMFEKGDYMITFDLKSAYHHVTIDKRFQTYLGFHWNGKYFTYTVLPFGLATAGFIFTKVTREIVKFWRSQGHEIIMYLDDGIAGTKSEQDTLLLSSIIQNDLKRFGFIIADEKSNWVPSQEITWLGLVWNMRTGHLRITHERLIKLIDSLSSVLTQLSNGNRVVSVRFLAGIVGQLISAQPVFGQVVRLRTRRAYECIQDRISWKSLVYITPNCEKELTFWLNNSVELNTVGACFGHLTEDQVIDFKLFCDASGEGYGGYIMSFDGDYVPGTTVYGNWDYNESQNSSTWRELEAVRRVMYSNLDRIEGQSLQVVSDNKNVKHILEVGSKKVTLNDICLDIVETCKESTIMLSSSWIPRNKNVKADSLSRRGDNDDWGIQWWVFKKLDQVWGPHTYDRFASSYNRKCDKFSSKFWCEGCFCINAMSQRWLGENNWLVPPPTLITVVVNKILKEKAQATLIIPVWKSAPYWPLIHRQDSFISEIKAYLFFKGENFTHRGLGKNGIFGKKFQNFMFVALRFT